MVKPSSMKDQQKNEDMEGRMTQEELNEMAAQLGCPDGEKGIEVGEILNDTNIGMTVATINSLEIGPKQHILEIGHGNGDHLDKILSRSEQVTYTGLEISDTMYREAVKRNETHIQNGNAAFMTYNGSTVPNVSNSFDGIMTVNTIYFWTNPLDFLNELHRVLKPTGILAITYAQKHFMEQLPFVNDTFNLYNNDDIMKLVNKSDFQSVIIKDKTERVRTKLGDWVDRPFSVAMLKK